MKGTISTETAIAQMFKEFMKYVGFKNANVSVFEGARVDTDITVGIAFKIPVSFHHSETEIADRFISALREDIRNGEEFQRLASDIIKQRDQALNDVARLTMEVEELTPLRHHFETEMKLRHGTFVEAEGIKSSMIPKSGLK